MRAEYFLPEDYTPAEDEPFMNERQVEYFRRKLINWKNSILDETAVTIESMKGTTRNIPDVSDRASEETDSCLLYTSPSPRDATLSRMPSSA